MSKSIRRNKQTRSSNTDSARPFAELDQTSLANGRAGPSTDSAQLFAELDQPSSANGLAGSTGTRLRLVLVTLLPRVLRTHSYFVSIEGIVGTFQFKNRGNSSFLEGHSDWLYKAATVN
ncbi:hypothetical protein F2Q70_00038980 [Brassica cretica]|uniref:Uncharacterized protein n=1 Tax=Brassica cretica TaxID=69181 RepID=A0A8S9K3Q2_BRACR|nr:hypothetical protein F2Q70_00038980 [Brassica cretica]